jgi:acetyl-CoA carboxylase carboxyl transferase subunit alpha
VICVIIGEGASGGALGIGIGDKVAMMENTWYSVTPPCSSILWRSWNFKEKAAEQLKLTSQDMSAFGLVDDVIQEPIGGAHSNNEQMAETLKDYLIETLAALNTIDPETRINQRYNAR